MNNVTLKFKSGLQKDQLNNINKLNLNNITLKFKAGLPKDQLNNLDELNKLLDSMSANPCNVILVDKIKSICNLTQVFSICEDDECYAFCSTSLFSIISIPKNSPNSSISKSDWSKLIDLLLQYCMGIPSNVSNILIEDFKDQLKTIESSTKNISDLLYRYDKAAVNTKIMLFPTTTLVNAKRPKEILDKITKEVKGKIFNVVRQELLALTTSRSHTRCM